MGISTSFCMVWIYKTEKMEKKCTRITIFKPFARMTFHCDKFYKNLDTFTTFDHFVPNIYICKTKWILPCFESKACKKQSSGCIKREKKDWSTYCWPEICVFTKRRHHQDPHITSKATRLSTTDYHGEMYFTHFEWMSKMVCYKE